MASFGEVAKFSVGHRVLLSLSALALSLTKIYKQQQLWHLLHVLHYCLCVCVGVEKKNKKKNTTVSHSRHCYISTHMEEVKLCWNHVVEKLHQSLHSWCGIGLFDFTIVHEREQDGDRPTPLPFPCLLDWIILFSVND